MKCRDCEHWGWGDDEGTPVWGWCWIRTSCPDPDIERTCPAFSPKAPDIFTALSTLRAENEKLRAENIRWGQVASEQDKAIDNLRKELEWKDKVIELAQRKEREAKAELERLKNCRHECKIECLLEEYNRVVAELKQLKGS